MERDIKRENGRGAWRCFAGSNTTMLTEALDGQPILVSFADVCGRPTWWRETLRPMLEAGRFPFAILDSGAFTVISQGISIDIEAYAAFAAEHAELFDVIVNLDSIAGDLEESHRNLETLRAAGVDAMPVFHEGEPWSELESMATPGAFIGVGFARREGGRLANPAAEREAWLAEVFARVGDRVRIHGFAMTRLAERFDFASVDSTTWISEYCALKRRTPGAPFIGTHGVGGELATRLADWTAAELAALAVKSHESPAREPRAIADAEAYSRGQARTVFRRYGAGLEAAICAIEGARYAHAA